MLRSLTIAQLREWIAFSELEPFGEQREDFRMANAMQLLANVNRDPKTRPAPFELKDFLLKFEGDRPEPPKEPTSWQEMKRVAMLYADLQNTKPH